MIVLMSIIIIQQSLTRNKYTGKKANTSGKHRPIERTTNIKRGNGRRPKVSRSMMTIKCLIGSADMYTLIIISNFRHIIKN